MVLPFSIIQGRGSSRPMLKFYKIAMWNVSRRQTSRYYHSVYVHTIWLFFQAGYSIVKWVEDTGCYDCNQVCRIWNFLGNSLFYRWAGGRGEERQQQPGEAIKINFSYSPRVYLKKKHITEGIGGILQMLGKPFSIPQNGVVSII